jgi:hypothetical protein
MREALSLRAEQVCVQMGNRWRQLSGIQPGGQVPSDKMTKRSASAMMRSTGAGKHVPPDFFVELEATVVDQRVPEHSASCSTSRRSSTERRTA